MGGYCSGTTRFLSGWLHSLFIRNAPPPGLTTASRIYPTCANAPFDRSIKLRPDRLDQCTPVRQIVLDELGKLRGREIDALEAVHAEELARLRQFQNLGHVGVDFCHQLGGHVRRPEQREPG